MAGTVVQETGAETTARQAAAVTLESTLTTMSANIASYLAAGSGDRHQARDAVKRFIVYRLQVAGLIVTDADRGGFTSNNLLSQQTLTKEG